MQGAGLATFKKAITPQTVIEVDNTKQTPLHHAAARGLLDHVQVLMKKRGVDPNAKCRNGWTPLHNAASRGFWKVLLWLLDHPSVNPTLLNDDNSSILHYIARQAVTRADQETFQEVLRKCEERGCSWYVANNNGEFPLHSAALKGNGVAITYAMNNAVLTELRNRRGETPLFYTVMTGKLDCAQIFLSHSANRFALTRTGTSVLDIAREVAVLEIMDVVGYSKIGFSNDELQSELMCAAREGLIDKVKELVSRGIDPNASDKYSMTPLLHAASNCHIDVVAYLLSVEAVDVNVQNDCGMSLLHFLAAFSRSHRPIADFSEHHRRLMLEALTVRGCNPNACSIKLETPLHIACLSSNAPAVSILLENGGDPLRATVNGDTPLHYAVMQHSLAAVSVLINATNIAAAAELKNTQGKSPTALAKDSYQAQLLSVLLSSLPAGTATLARSESSDLLHERKSTVFQRATRMLGTLGGPSHKKSSSSSGSSTLTTEISISPPTNLVHLSHVDTQMNWKRSDNSTTDATMWRLEDKLGEGAYGSVYRGAHIESGFEVAIKTFKVSNKMSDILREVDILRKCSHPNIVAYLGCYKQADGSLWILMDYCAGGSVYDILRKRQAGLKEKQIASICLPVLHGLAYLHHRGVIHRDLKAANILLTAEGFPKIADFGVSAQVGPEDDKLQSIVGTPLWMSPEVLEGSEYDDRADIWSLGITSIEMAEGSPPHFRENLMRAMFLISTQPPPTLKEPSQWSLEFNSFVQSCLHRDPFDRPTALKLVEHSFVIISHEECEQTNQKLVRELAEIHQAAAAATMVLERSPLGKEKKPSKQSKKAAGAIKADQPTPPRGEDKSTAKSKPLRVRKPTLLSAINTGRSDNPTLDLMRERDALHLERDALLLEKNEALRRISELEVQVTDLELRVRELTSSQSPDAIELDAWKTKCKNLEQMLSDNATMRK